MTANTHKGSILERFLWLEVGLAIKRKLFRTSVRPGYFWLDPPSSSSSSFDIYKRDFVHQPCSAVATTEDTIDAVQISRFPPR